MKIDSCKNRGWGDQTSVNRNLYALLSSRTPSFISRPRAFTCLRVCRVVTKSIDALHSWPYSISNITVPPYYLSSSAHTQIVARPQVRAPDLALASLQSAQVPDFTDGIADVISAHEVGI